MRLAISASLISVALMSLIQSCFGTTLAYDNGAGGAAGIDQAYLAEAPYRIADDLSLASAFAVSRVEWTGVYNGTLPSTDDFTLAFYQDAAGSPAAGSAFLIHPGGNVTRIDTGFDTASHDIYSFSAAVNFTIGPQTTWWLAIFNDSGNNATFYWGGDGQSGGNAHGSGTQGDSWFDDPQRITLDFRIYGTPVPESSSAMIALCAVGATRLLRSRLATEHRHLCGA